MEQKKSMAIIRFTLVVRVHTALINGANYLRINEICCTTKESHHLSLCKMKVCRTGM